MTTKNKKAAKKATAKTERAPRKSNLYQFATGKGDFEISGQGLVVKEALAKLQPATVGALANAVEKKLETKQPAVRVVAHYIGIWKTKKLVKVAAAPKQAAA